MPSHSTTTGANRTPLGRVNPALLAAQTGRRPTNSSLLNPNYLCTDDDNASHAPSSYGSQDSQSSQHSAAFAAAAAAAAALAPQVSSGWKRSIDQNEQNSNDSDSNSTSGDRRKKRRSRWGGDEKEKTFIPGMPTVLPANLTKEQQEAYLGEERIQWFIFTE